MVTNAAHFLPRVPFGVCHGTANRASLFARPLDGPTRILNALTVSVNQRRLGVWRVPPCLPRSLSRLPRAPAPEDRSVRIVAPLPFQFARHDSGYRWQHVAAMDTPRPHGARRGVHLGRRRIVAKERVMLPLDPVAGGQMTIGRLGRAVAGAATVTPPQLAQTAPAWHRSARPERLSDGITSMPLSNRAR